MFQTTIAGQLAADQQTEIFSKMSIPKAFNMFYESALSLVTDARFTPGLDGKLATVQAGDKLKGIRAFQSAKDAFKNAFGKVANVETIISPIINSFEAQINQGGEQYLQEQISKYNKDMAAGGNSGPDAIQIQDYFDVDGNSVNDLSIRAYDMGKTNKILFRVNPPITSGTPAQRAAKKQAQDNLLRQLGYLDAQGKSVLVDDPNTSIDESIAYMIYAGSGQWIAQ